MPSQPSTPSRGEKGDKGDTGETGPQGPAGPAGPQGPPGKDAVVDNDQLAAAVLSRLQLVIQWTDKTGAVIEETPFVYNPATKRLEAKIEPLTVETYDASGKFVDSDRYAIPWGIKLKPIIIREKGT